MVVVGSTGSGKSSLLGAALGLMQQVEGEPVRLRGKARALQLVPVCVSLKFTLPFGGSVALYAAGGEGVCHILGKGFHLSFWTCQCV